MLCLFDLDGTLIDSERAVLGGIRHAMHTLGEPVPQNLRSWIGPPLKYSLDTHFAERPEHAARALELYYERFHDVGHREHDVYPGIAQMLQTLHTDGHTLAVCTSKPHPHAVQVVGDLPFGELFSQIYGPGLGVAESQKAQMVASAMRDFSFAAGDTVMVGDRLYDMEGAVANHVAGIGVLWGFGDRDELLAAGAVAVIDQPMALVEWVRGR